MGVEKIWRRQGRSERNTDALHAMISTPLLEGDYVYGVDSYGELRCLELATGDRVWEDLTAVPKARWSTIHLTVNGSRVFLFNERGELIIARLSPAGYEEISRAINTGGLRFATRRIGEFPKTPVLAFDPDGRRLAIAGKGTSLVFDVETQHYLQCDRSHYVCSLGIESFEDHIHDAVVAQSLTRLDLFSIEHQPQ